MHLHLSLLFQTKGHESSQSINFSEKFRDLLLRQGQNKNHVRIQSPLLNMNKKRPVLVARLFYAPKLKAQFAYYSNKMHRQRSPDPGIKHLIKMQPLKEC